MPAYSNLDSSAMFTSSTTTYGGPALTYDDIMLVPAFSKIESRKDTDVSTPVSARYQIAIPLIASPMDTVCEVDMAIAMARLGGVGCIHRYMSIEEQATQVHATYQYVNAMNHYKAVMAAVGVKDDYLERAQELTRRGANIILIDVAHGHHSLVRDALTQLKKKLPSSVDIIAGNVATADGAISLEEWGADAIRVGIGGGSLCTTRIKTGFGVPNVTALMEIRDATDLPLIADGGIRSSADIVKALALGAHSVMLGSLLAGTEEAPGDIIETPQGLFKRYRGSASLETKLAHGQDARNVEGEATLVPFKGGVKFVVNSLLDGLRSGLSYAGATCLADFEPNVIQVTSAGLHEARPHLKS